MPIELKQISNKEERSKNSSSYSKFTNILNKDIQLSGNKLKDKKKERFYSDLYTLLSSGIDIKTAMELIIEEQKRKADIKMWNDIQKRVIEGSGLSDAIQQSGRFSDYEYYSLKIGEESGRLNEIMRELSSFFNKKIKQKRQLVSAFSYPIMVLFTAVFVMIFMMNFIVPMFVDVYKRFNGELPGITKFVIKLSEFISGNTYYFLLFIVVLFVFYLTQKNKKWLRKSRSFIMLRLPIFGKVIKKIYIARFCHAMALLTASRTPMLRAIELVKKMIGFYPLEQALFIVEQDIVNGKSLHHSLKSFNIFDGRFLSLVKVGEEVNQLDIIFDKLNKQYADDLEHEISIMSGLLEPILIIFVGLLVGFILIAMYLPLFQLSTSVYN